MAETTASRLAAYILGEAAKRQIPMTNLKLQKFLYYCQAWHLALNEGKPLFDDQIEAWIHGPVVPSVFYEYRSNRPIAPPTDCPVLPESIQSHVAEVLDAYGHLSGEQLERLTRLESPWKVARNGIPADAPSTEPLSWNSMRDTYSTMLSNG